MAKFKTKKIDQQKKQVNEEKDNKLQDKELEKLYSKKDNLSSFDRPAVHSRVTTISLVVAIIFGFLSGIVGVIFFLTGSLSFLKVGVEDILPAQQFKIEHHEQVNVLDDERFEKLNETVFQSVVAVYEKKEVTQNVLDNVYLSSEIKGSGFILTADGWVVTHAKAISDTANDYVVVTSDKQVLDVEDFVFDDFSGVVFLKVKASNLSTLPIVEAKDLAVGERLLVVKNLADSKIESLVKRLVKKDWQDNSSQNSILKMSSKATNYLLLDGNLNKSFNGSPVINLEGEVVGLIIGSADNVLARAAEDFKLAITQVLSGKQKIERVILGVKYIDLSQVAGSSTKIKKGEQTSLVDKGALIAQVVANSAAAEAGLEVGDIVVKVGDRDVNFSGDLSRLLQFYEVGDSVVLSVLRQGEEGEMLITANF